jgi:hypothetical protein
VQVTDPGRDHVRSQREWVSTYRSAETEMIVNGTPISLDSVARATEVGREL